jgi:hypothetical protein
MKEQNTYPVSEEVFQAVYDSPTARPGRYRWLTCEAGVRKIE